ncbi:MAG: glycoside hydrolase family 9 protein [Bryobacteraceae bacterium]
MRIPSAALVLIALLAAGPPLCRAGGGLEVNAQQYLEEQGLSVLLYHNRFHPVFVDQKVSAMEIVLHGERIATNGDVRLAPTPEQWDAVPTFERRTADKELRRLTAFCSFPAYGIRYRLEVTAEDGGLRVAIHLDKPLPDALVGQAGFNLEFLPSAYFGKTYLLEDGFGVFPRHPGGPMTKDRNGKVQPQPLASGESIVLAPEDPLVRVAVRSETGPLMLFDGRNLAQNGWFVLRSLIPAGKTENAVVWHIRPHVIPGWLRPPVIAHSQAGYHPDREKAAVLELDPGYAGPKEARVLKLLADGECREVLRGPVTPWGKWFRYNYARFDFSSVREPGLYTIEYAGQRTEPFPIAKDVYSHIWQPSLDTYLAVQMDHVSVREGYRVWHGASHLDDARQAPLNHTHFDGYAQGPTTDSPFQPGEHIPGLNQGGWFDAGDFDIRTQTQDEVILDLVLAIEEFHVAWDETSIDEQARSVEIRRPDGIPDALQQVEHGVRQVLGQFRVFGHSIPGIVEPTLRQYTHLGDAASKTDNQIYSEKLGRLESDGLHSGIPDDRWAFTNRATPLQYRSAAALAAASRVLRGYNDSLARECLETAERVWAEEHSQPPSLFHSFNTTGGALADEELGAAVELLIATRGGAAYRDRLREMLPEIQGRMAGVGWIAVRALPYLDAGFKAKFAAVVREYKTGLDAELAQNPFGVPIGLTGWGGSGAVAGFGVRMYFLDRAFPEMVGPEYTLRAVNYLLGAHPVSSTSWVSGVGTRSTLMAYGSNRADFTYIPGGLAPGFAMVKPDLPEFKEDWPFLWFEKEYVVSAATAFILAANAADALVK